MAIQFIPVSPSDAYRSGFNTQYSLGSNFTYVLWIRPTTDFNTSSVSVAFSANSSNRFITIDYMEDNKFQARYFSDNGAYSVISPATTYDKYDDIMIALTYDGTTFKMYAGTFGSDTTLEGSLTRSHDGLTSPFFNLGYNGYGAGLRPVVLGEFSQFDKALSKNNIDQMIRGLNPLNLNPTAYVPAQSVTSSLYDVVNSIKLNQTATVLSSYFFRSTADSTFTAPIGSTDMDTDLYGAGAGGGGSDAIQGGGGGGSGARVQKNYTNNAGTDYAYSIASGASGGGADTSGSNALDSTFDTLTAGGGQGGGSGSSGGAGGSGGTASGGDTNTNGNDGQDGDDGGSGGGSLYTSSVYNEGGDGAVVLNSSGRGGDGGLLLVNGDYDRVVEHFPIEAYNYPYITSGTSSSPPPAGTTVPPLYYNLEKRRK